MYIICIFISQTYEYFTTLLRIQAHFRFESVEVLLCAAWKECLVFPLLSDILCWRLGLVSGDGWRPPAFFKLKLRLSTFVEALLFPKVALQQHASCLLFLPLYALQNCCHIFLRAFNWVETLPTTQRFTPRRVGNIPLKRDRKMAELYGTILEESVVAILNNQTLTIQASTLHRHHDPSCQPCRNRFHLHELLSTGPCPKVFRRSNPSNPSNPNP